MELRVISFTAQGRCLGERIKECLPREEVILYEKPDGGIVFWAEEAFKSRSALIFIGACGIAVRAIAPFVKDKLTDSPVVVLDEKGRYVIPILSGHAGGANELAKRLAEAVGAVPVITTATDINGKFAVDVFAMKNQLVIMNKEGIAKVSSKALRGERITVSVEDSNPKRRSFAAKATRLPDEVDLLPYPPNGPVDVLVASDAAKRELNIRPVLWLKPREYVLGIGSRRGKSIEELTAFLDAKLALLGIDSSDIAVIASIEEKRTEEGICRWAERHRIPFRTFSKEELRAVRGRFHGSYFVEKTVGVDNVCERAALAASGKGGTLILEKQAENGMTMAVARRVWQIRWSRCGKYDSNE